MGVDPAISNANLRVELTVIISRNGDSEIYGCYFSSTSGATGTVSEFVTKIHTIINPHTSKDNSWGPLTSQIDPISVDLHLSSDGTFIEVENSN